jgi:hypothetical protein
MADEPQKVKVQASRIDAKILPPGFSLPYRLYVIQQTTDLKNLADASNNANDLAYQATIKNEEQDVILADHESRISALRVEVDDHEVRITGNTAAIAALTVRVTTAEGNITTLQTSVSGLTSRVTAAENNITSIQGDYVSKSATASQSLASPLSVTTSYSVGGIKVVGVRNTGWTASIGTSSKAGINGSASYAVSSTYTQSEVQSIASGLQEVRRLVVALQNALGASSGHGLIDS